jgi:4-amino-4-deoxy-L-arabinose transferase-like glycosyltransferase
MNRTALILAVTAAAIHALLLFVAIPAFTDRQHPVYSEDIYADGYDQLAQSLLSGNGYRFYPDTAPTLLREPGYPVLLAGIMVAFGHSFAAVKIVNMCLALMTAWLMTGIASRISTSRILIYVPPLLFLFHPGTLVAESRGGVEILFTFLVVTFMVALLWAMERNRMAGFAIAGAVLGLTVLVRSTPLFFPVFLLAYFLWIEKERKIVAVGRIAVMTAAMFVVLSPWIARNYHITGKFIPTASVLGVSAQAGQYICFHRPEGKPLWQLDREAALERDAIADELHYRLRSDDFYYQSFYSTANELSFSSYLAHRVISNYQQKPLVCLKCMTYNLFNFWFAGKKEASTLGNLAVQLPYLLMGIAGIIVSVRSRQTEVAGLLVLFMAYVMSTSIPILAQARYSIPLIPFLSILIGVALAAVREKMLKPQRPLGEGHGINRPLADIEELAGQGRKTL